MHQQLATAVRWLSEHGPALADLLAKPVAEPSTQPSTLSVEQTVPVDYQDTADRMTPHRRNLVAQRLLRQQFAKGGKPSLKWRKVDAKLDWLESLCVVLVRAVGRANPQELAAITGLPQADVAKAVQRLFMAGIIANKVYATGMYFVPREAESIGP